VLTGEATNTNFIVFGLTRSGLEPMIYGTRAEHAHYITPPMRFTDATTASYLNSLLEIDSEEVVKNDKRNGYNFPS
jgi:hypothetical protein